LLDACAWLSWLGNGLAAMRWDGLSDWAFSIAPYGSSCIIDVVYCWVNIQD